MAKRPGAKSVWGISQKTETAFEQLLERGAQKIIKAADGKTCGGCAAYTGTSCLTNTSPTTGLNLEITDPAAPACKSWEEIKVIKVKLGIRHYGRRS